jgi:hypothetical protein
VRNPEKLLARERRTCVEEAAKFDRAFRVRYPDSLFLPQIDAALAGGR